jgi:HTH-type transcriptional regulator/antitoxin MqsA
MIGGGPRAFQKYESGDLLPSRAANSALALLGHNPESLSVLINATKNRMRVSLYIGWAEHRRF